jgi:hypothetical protein
MSSQVGFDQENRSVVNVDFHYSGTLENGSDVQRTLTVPLLAMMPIPSIEVRTPMAAGVQPWSCVRLCVSLSLSRFARRHCRP